VVSQKLTSGHLRGIAAWLAFEDEAGFSMTPPQAKTWSPHGRTPVVRVRGRSGTGARRRAHLLHRPGHRSMPIHRPHRDDDRRDGARASPGAATGTC